MIFDSIKRERDHLLNHSFEKKGEWINKLKASNRAEIEKLLPEGNNIWQISQDLGRILANLILQESLNNVLEFGAGSSSRIIAKALAIQGKGSLTSIEQDPTWCKEIWDSLKEYKLVDTEMIVAQPALRIGWQGIFYWFGTIKKRLESRGPFDLIFVDSPQYYFGREGAVSLVQHCIKEGTWLVLDDAFRNGEKWAIYRWVKFYPGWELVYYDKHFGNNKNGVAILRFNGKTEKKANPALWLSTFKIYFSNYILRRKKRDI